jgi:hypothetical protein
MHSSLRRQLLHLATDLSALAENPDDLGHAFDLLTRSYATPAADGARAALRKDPAINAVNVMQLRWPGSAMLLGAELLHRCLDGASSSEVDLGQAAAYGLELGRVCAPLLAQRWEEGWDRSLADWREQLGITAVVAGSPFRGLTARA